MSLREDVIEAGAAVIASFDGYDVIDGRNGVAPWSTYQDDAAKVLDAMLNALDERAEVWAASIAAPKDEWEDPAAYDSMLRAMSKRDRRLIDALRVGVEEKT